MSIEIDKKICTGCKRCVEACPGNLIKIDENKKAYIKYPKDCWGCTACIKECKVHAIKFFLGADIGGLGSKTFTEQNGDILKWQIETPNKKTVIVEIDRKESNKY